MAFSDASDEKLMREAAAGRFSAFDEFMERHQGRIYNFLWRLLGSREAASALFEGLWSELYKMRGSQAASRDAATLAFGLAARRAVRLLSENPSLSPPRGAAPGGDPSSLEWRSARLND